MKLWKVGLIGGVVAGGGALAWWALSDDDDAKSGKKGSSGKGADDSQPGPKAPDGGADTDGVFRLDGQGLQHVVCSARNASSASALIDVLRGVQIAVRNSGAERVDVRNTGIVTEVMTVEQFDGRVNSGVQDLKGMTGFFWPIAKAAVTSKLSALPLCSAPAQTWASAAAGTLQLAVTEASMPEPLWGIEKALFEERETTRKRAAP